ncbi:hypothetical protein GOP47_0001814 [Adiantum capillus-veneris]|uniref:3'-5' exonuclease n=1 Tax=Adiantum capillus-veneris TaxID=13818 RepID=A0A9D4VAA6_ADICA|nr:hypothetical protein GOP47_0001814 [Adiantum capillus-veneris]
MHPRTADSRSVVERAANVPTPATLACQVTCICALPAFARWMDSSHVPFQLIDADEFDALDVAIAAAERSSSSCKKFKFSIPFPSASSSYTSRGDTGSDPPCESTVSAPIKLANRPCSELRTSNGVADYWQTSCDLLHAATEGWERCAEYLENGYARNDCDILHKHSEGEPPCGLLSRSDNEGDAAEEGGRAYQGGFRGNAHGDRCDGAANGATLHSDNLDELSRATYSSNAGHVYEADKAINFSVEETHSKPRCSRRLPSWQLYASSRKHKSVRPLGRTKTIQTISFVDEEAQPADILGDVCIDNSRLAWGFEPPARIVVPKQKLPYLQFKGRIIHSVTSPDAERAAYELLRLLEAKKAVGKLVPLGFDAEWKVVFKRGAQPRKVAVLQLCINADQCNVFHIIYTGIPPPLRTILEDPSVAKVGVGAYGDAARLFTDYNVKVKGVKDLSGLANLKLASAACAKSWSLASLAEKLLGKQVNIVNFKCLLHML